MSEAMRFKNSESHKGIVTWNKVIPPSKETIEKMRLVQSKIPRKKPSEETKLKMSLAHMGRVGAMKGKNHTEESKAKMRESFAKIKVWTGRKHSPESIEKMRLVKLGKKNPRKC